MSKAYVEAKRVRNLVAFNVIGATNKRKFNQHMVEYTFSDGSVLKVYSGRVEAYENGLCIYVGITRANTFGE